LRRAGGKDGIFPKDSAADVSQEGRFGLDGAAQCAALIAPYNLLSAVSGSTQGLNIGARAF
jgi:hypothetical protein